MSSVSFKGIFWNISATSIKDLNGYCLVSDIIHKFTRDKYSKRFPELESLVPDSLDYIRTVKVRSDVVYFSVKPDNNSICVVWPVLSPWSLRNWEIIWRNARTTKHSSRSSPMPLLWWSVSQLQPHKGERTHIFISILNLNICILVQKMTN